MLADRRALDAPDETRRELKREKSWHDVLLNVVASGGKVLEAASHDGAASATVPKILRSDVGERFGIARAVLNSFWDKFIPIGERLGLRFAREGTEEGTYRIRVGRE